MAAVSCSWCHAFNPVGSLSCRYCGHNADRSRMECDCPACMGTEPPPGVEDTIELFEPGTFSEPWDAPLQPGELD